VKGPLGPPHFSNWSKNFDEGSQRMQGQVGLFQVTQVPPQCQWRNKVAVGPRASIPKGPPLPQKNFLKTASGKFWAPTALGPRALHAPLLRHCTVPLLSFWATVNVSGCTGTMDRCV